MSPVSLSLILAEEAWQLDLPAHWLSRFQNVFKHLVRMEAAASLSMPRVRIKVRAAGTATEVNWANTLCSRLPTSDSVAAVNRETEVVHVSTMALDTYHFQELRGESVLLDPAMESNYLGTNLLLRHVAWRAKQRSLVPIHAAAVGDGERFWLIPAGAGKGKSTTTAAAIAGGLMALGDDFVLLDPDTNILHSLYQTIRLQPSSRRMIDRDFGDGLFAEVAIREDEKQILIPGPTQGPGGFQSSGTLEGILLPEKGNSTRIGSCVSPRQGLQAFSSTLRLLPTLGYPAGFAFHAISDITRRLETRTFEISSDLTQVAACLQNHVGSGFRNVRSGR